MKAIAVILAAGKGSRWGGNVPKQFYIVNGKRMYAHSVEIFNRHPQIDEIVIVVPESYRDMASEEVLKNKWNKVIKVIKGGTERHHSTSNALSALKNEKSDTVVLFHDAARPYVSSDIISRVIDALQTANAVTAAVPATDTVAQASDNEITNIPNRDFLYHIQTPQGFRIDIIRDAYANARKDKGLIATDDCGIVLKYLPKEKIIIVKGSEKNVKCTFNTPI
ncbi:MAG: 2-C-methyl-D-erythritol 4-phosphate cytidylyltransferase [Bacteroidales bacterium]|jgi:2-C-methyl-D-erythritol 4-phosphate cytidylyltransferase|nr:2-C-methyl-D-erythritol 4-phosphate cytidylyltransferase [Bacteroidales bacterium]